MRAKDFTVEADSYQPPELSVGDRILKGKFKNSPAEIKGFTKDKHNQPVLKTNKGEVQLFKPRVTKLMDKDVAEDREYIPSGKTRITRHGIDLVVSIDGVTVDIRAMSGDSQMAYVVFDRDGDTLVADDLAVEEQYKGQGIAKIMYDYVKELGFRVKRSSDQLVAGKKFWDKNKGAKNNIWEQGVAEGSEQKYVWHGSRQPIKMLEPRQSVDTGGAAGSNQNAIYATSDPKVAIAVGGLTTPDSDTAMFPNDPQMVLFSGKIRKGENVYLHKLPFYGTDGKPQFVQGAHDREFYSMPGVKGIKPVEIKAVPVDKYLNLIRTATPNDLELRKQNMKEGVAEGTEKVNPLTKLTNAVISFYKPVVDQIEPGAVDNYVKQAKELLNQAPDPTIRSRMREIFKKGQKDPMIQGGVVTAIAAILTGGLLSSASRMGLSPAQTNILLQAVLNTVIPTIIARINNCLLYTSPSPRD